MLMSSEPSSNTKKALHIIGDVFSKEVVVNATWPQTSPNKPSPSQARLGKATPRDVALRPLLDEELPADVMSSPRVYTNDCQ